MKKSKSSSKRKKDRSSPDDSKSKRTKTPSTSRGKEKVKGDSKAVPRKTRWQSEDKKEVSKTIPTTEPATKKEKSEPLPRIKDCLHDKEKIVDLLFQTVTGAALQELIPDYLKKRSNDELKKLCLEQIKKMSDEVILQIIAGKVDSSNKKENAVEKEEILKPEQPSSPKESKEEKVAHEPEKKPKVSDAVDKSGTDAAEPQAAESIEMDERTDEENQIPLVIKDEVAKDLILPERDAELLELEMRARAIRSLLKAKSQSTQEEETK